MTSYASALLVAPQSIVAELSADCVTPIAFSGARLFQPAQYGLFAQIRYSRRLGDYVLYSIAKHVEGSYNLADPIYRSSSYEDIADVWSLFSK